LNTGCTVETNTMRSKVRHSSRLVVVLLFLLAVPMRQVAASTITAANCSSSSVQAAINSAVDGDTVVIPNGTCTWTSGISVSGKGIHVTGQTKGGVLLSHSAGGSTLIMLNRDGNHSVELSNLTLLRGTGSGRYLVVGGSGQIPLIHDNYFDVKSISPLQHIQFTSNGGVFYRNQVVAGTVKPPPGGANYGHYHFDGCIQINPDSAGDSIWTAPHTLGVADSNGTANTYFEDNTFEGCLQQSVDGSNGAKVVFRHNTMRDAAVVMHGADTDQYGGCRHWEFYNNTFVRVYNAQSTGAVPINRWFYIRGCTGVITDNVIPEASTSDSFYPGKAEIDLTIQYLRRRAGDYGCWNSGYPAPHQVGQVTDERDATPSFPIAIWNNTGSGTSSSNFISRSDYSPDECGGGASIATYVQPGRDYITSAPSNYEKYPYPHPLTTGGAPPPLLPPPPSALTVN
jgi:hypothetical protein